MGHNVVWFQPGEGRSPISGCGLGGEKVVGVGGGGGDEVARDQCNRVEPTVQAQLQKEETERE